MRQRPNILWIQCDEIRPDSLSCYPGNPWITPQTPNIQHLADGGLVFENMFCPSPVCMPSRGSEMTSQYVTTLGVYHNVTKRHRDTYCFDTSWPTWTGRLRQAGYRAVNVGKLHIVDYDAWEESLSCPQFPRPRGLLAASGADLHLSVLPGINLIIGGTYPLDAGDEESFGARRITRMGLEKLSELRKGNAPWVLRFSYIAPHTPVIAPPPFDTMYPEEAFPFEPERDTPSAGMSAYEKYVSSIQQSEDVCARNIARARATYYGLVSAIDREVGLIMEHLPENTIVLFTGDHGAMLGEMGLWQKQIFNRNVHQVPYIVSAPGIAPGRRRDLCDLLDSGPTLLSLCGVDSHSGFTGRDLLGTDLREKDIFAAFGYGDAGSYLYEALFRGPDCPRRVCIRSGPYRLDLSVMANGERLEGEDQDAFFCDSNMDPEERANQIADPRYRNTVADLKRRLFTWYESTAGQD